MGVDAGRADDHDPRDGLAGAILANVRVLSQFRSDLVPDRWIASLCFVSIAASRRHKLIR